MLSRLGQGIAYAPGALPGGPGVNRPMACNAVGSRTVLSVAVLERPTVQAEQQEAGSSSTTWNLPAPMARSTRTHSRRQERIRQSKQHEASPPPPDRSEALAEPKYRQLEKAEEYTCCRIIQEARKLEQAPSTRSSPGRSTPADAQHRAQVLRLATEAQHLLLESYRRYITAQAKRIQAGMTGSQRVSYDDMFQAGAAGLLLAAQRFKLPATVSTAAPTPQVNNTQPAPHTSSDGSSTLTAGDTAGEVPGTRFLTFAHFYIRKYMIQTLKDFSQNDVFIPRHVTDNKRRVLAALEELSASGHNPSIAEVAERAGVTKSVVSDVLHASSLTVMSLELPPDNGDDNATRTSRGRIAYADQTAGDGSDAADNLEEALTVASTSDESVARMGQDTLNLTSVLERVLSQREMDVLQRTLGLSLDEAGDAREPALHKEVAAELGISRQRVSQIHDGALRKLRQACAEGLIRADVEQLCAVL